MLERAFQLRANRLAAQTCAPADLTQAFPLHVMADQPPPGSFRKVLKRLTQPIFSPVVAPLTSGIGELIEEDALPAITPGAVLGCWLVKAAARRPRNVRETCGCYST